MTFDKQVLHDAKHLKGLGFAIHRLHVKEKRPVGNEWTTNPILSWKQFEAAYEPGENLGVRLGASSEIRPGLYLGVIDIDMRWAESKERCYSKLAEIVGGVDFPRVDSGSGGGSAHLYFVSRELFKPRLLGEELDPVATEIKTDKKTGKERTVKRKNWEIKVYCNTGHQFVLPPSIHPISGKPYEWGWQGLPESVESFPEWVCPMGVRAAKTANKKAPKKGSLTKDKRGESDTLDFKVTSIVLDWEETVKESTKLLIKEGKRPGKQINDRSDWLPLATKELMDAGITDINDILTILTDEKTYLGSCAMERRNGNRASAMEWLWSGTVEKASAEWRARHRKPGSAQDAFGASPTQPGGAENGFHKVSDNGKTLKTPDYDALLAEYLKIHPYKTIAEMENIFIFTGTHYEISDPITAGGFAERMLNPKPLERERREFYHKLLANNIERRDFFTETIKEKLNFKNGVLDLSNSELLSHSPDFGFQAVLPYDYISDAECPEFRKWLDSILLGDRELVTIMQEYMGYIIRGGDYKYHKCLWLDGEGRNGKSTFIDVLKNLIGPRNYSTIKIKDMAEGTFASAELDGKFANFSEETSPKELRDSGTFKNITGDGEISVQKKYGQLYMLRNKAKLVMSYNKIPDLSDNSLGMLSRPIIIPFLKVIEEHEQDQGTKSRLLKELSGIFNFALEGWHRLEKQGHFTVSKASKERLQVVKEESCGVHRWVIDSVRNNDKDPQSLCAARDFYNAYRKSTNQPYGDSEFFRRLRQNPLMRDHYVCVGRNERSYYRGKIIESEAYRVFEGERPQNGIEVTRSPAKRVKKAGDSRVFEGDLSESSPDEFEAYFRP